MPIWLMAVLGLGIAALVVVVVLIFVLSDGDTKPPRGQGE